MTTMRDEDKDTIKKMIEKIRDNQDIAQLEKTLMLEKILMGFCIIANKEYQLCRKA